MKFFYVFAIVLGILFAGGESSRLRRSNLDSLELALEVYESNKMPLERSAVDSATLNTKQNYLRELISQARTELRQLTSISDRSSSADDARIVDVVQNRGNIISGQVSQGVKPTSKVTQYYLTVKDRIEAQIESRRARAGIRPIGRVTFHDDSLTKLGQKRLRKGGSSGTRYNLAVDIGVDGRLNRCEFAIYKPSKNHRKIMANVLLGLKCRDVQDRKDSNLPEETIRE